MTLGVLAAGYLAGLAFAVPQLTAGPERVPTGLEPALEALPTGSVVLVEDGVGSWVEWQVEGVDPVIEGMLDAYPVEHIRDFFAMTDLEPGWQDFVTETGADVAVVRTDSPVTGALQDQLGWQAVDRDAGWVLLRPGQR